MVHLPRGSQLLSSQPIAIEGPKGRGNGTPGLVKVIPAAEKGRAGEESIISVFQEQATSYDMRIGNSHKKKHHNNIQRNAN